MRECWNDWGHHDYWRARRCPKSNRIPPETITKDWDRVNLSSLGSVFQYTGDTFGPEKNEVAGRYGTWTNIYTIGKVMEAVITKNWSSHPMTTMRYKASDGRCFGNSYAWRLCQPEHGYIETELLDLIAQCQYERPQDRPQLSYLLKNVCERKHRGFEESDDETRAFWDAFLARTRTNPDGRPPSPFSQSQTSTAVGGDSASPRDIPADRGQREYQSDPFARTTFLVSPSPSPPAGYDEIGNPLITHVAALRRKSRRSLLSVSSEGSAPGPSRRPVLSTGLQATALNPLASSPADNSAPFGGIQRVRPSSESADDDSGGGAPLHETESDAHDSVFDVSSSSANRNSLDGRVPLQEANTTEPSPDEEALLQGAKRASKASSSPSVPLRRTKVIKNSSKPFPISSGNIFGTWRVSKMLKRKPVKTIRFADNAALDDIMSQSISDDFARLNCKWPIVPMAPRRIPNVLEIDVRDGERLAGYAAISPERLDLPQREGGFSFTKRSDPSYYETEEEAFSRIRFDIPVVPAHSIDFAPMETILEEREGRMDLD
ncbi:hypothetical protein ACQKWADRAFT_279668 [Trichoderma austrokoningii]